MSQFTNVLLVSPMDDGNTWVIMREFGFARGSADSQEVIDVPVGFLTDFASVPPVFRGLLPKWGKYGNAAVIHDWLYWIQSPSYPREEADKVFLEAMKVMGVGVIKRSIIYKAVRLFGCWAWLRNTEDKVSNYNRVLESTDIKAGTESKRKGSFIQVRTALVRKFKERLAKKSSQRT